MRDASRKKTAVIVLILVMTLLTAGSMTAHAAGSKKKALAAYKTFLEQNMVQRNARGAITNASTAITRFAIIYLDKNSVPELIVEKSGLMMSPFVYTWKNGKMTALSSSNFSASETVYGYYKKKGCLVMSYESNGYPYHSFINDYAVIKGKKLIRRLRKQYLGTASKAVEGPNYSYNSKNTTDSSPSKKITKSSFNSKLKKIVGSKKMVKIKLVENTAGNRNAKCK